ncbi:MAG: hypothetical protein HY700_02070 [Gemmatimonadetes bacterium]|nr:hypothetical protein [Gemmatimonadota bacterium]
MRVVHALVAKELAQAVYIVLKEGVEFNQQFKGTPLEAETGVVPRRASPSV